MDRGINSQQFTIIWVELDSKKTNRVELKKKRNQFKLIDSGDLLGQ